MSVSGNKLYADGTVTVLTALLVTGAFISHNFHSNLKKKIGLKMVDVNHSISTTFNKKGRGEVN